MAATSTPIATESLHPMTIQRRELFWLTLITALRETFCHFQRRPLGVGMRRLHDEPRVKRLRLCRISCEVGRSCCPEKRPEPDRFRFQRGLERLQRLGGLIDLHQHFSEELTRGDKMPRHYGILLCRVLAIGSGTQHLQSFVPPALCVRDPRHYDLVIVLDL